MRLARGTLALSLILGLGSTSNAVANPAVTSQVAKSSRGSISPNYTIGWDFQVTQEIMVTHLGFFDMLETSAGHVGDGLFESHQIGIWGEDGTLLTSASVAAGLAAPESGGFRYVPISGITLLPDTIYLIGAHFNSSCSINNGDAGDCLVHRVAADFLYPSNFLYDDIVRSGGSWRFATGFAAPLGSSDSTEGFGPTFRFTPGPESDPRPPAPGTGPAILSDPPGDVYLFDGPLPPGSPQAPDILEVTAGYTADDLIVSATFAIGTLQPGLIGTLYVLGLDLDLNPLTGGPFVPGADKLLLFATDLTFATLCDGLLPVPSCGIQVPVTTQGDRLEVVLPLDASGLDDDGVALFGFVAGLFLDGVPVSEDDAFDGVSGSLERNLTVTSGFNLGAPAAECSPAPGNHTFEMMLEGVIRKYDVHVPPSCDAESPMPFVFNFHGLFSNSAAQAAVSGFLAKADEEGFIVVHPQGYLDSWNSGWCCSFGTHQLDDVAFARDILETLDEGLPIDRSRVYTTGLSNGGAMSHWLACNAADMIAAAVPVAYHLSVIDDCEPSQPVAVLQIHGTADDTVPYLGSAVTWPTAPESIARWAELNGCEAEPTRTVALPDAFCDEHQGCDDGATAALCTLIDAPHVPYLAAAQSGIPIADIAWDFFNEKTLAPEPATTWLQLAALATLAAFRARRRRS